MSRMGELDLLHNEAVESGNIRVARWVNMIVNEQIDSHISFIAHRELVINGLLRAPINRSK